MANPLPSPSHDSSTSADRWTRLTLLALRCSRQLRRRLSGCISSQGLSDTEFLLMWCCAAAGDNGVPQNELAALVGVSPAQTSGLVERLQKRDLLVKSRCQQDRRRQTWRLTADGTSLFLAALKQVEPLGNELDDSLPQSEQQFAETLLTRLIGTPERNHRLRIFPAADEPQGKGNRREGAGQ